MERERTLRILERHGIPPNQLLDQHFMADPVLIQRIVSLAGIKPGETVLEIGAGIGTLTTEIARKARKVLAVDIDKRFMPLLRKACPSNVELVSGNALRLIGSLKFDRLVSNTPYSICEPLLQRLAKKEFRLVVLTLPEGFIRRLQKENSRLSLFASSFFSLEVKLRIPREAFRPVPKTESGVVLIRHKRKSEYKRNPCSYILKRLFLQGDRKLKNALREALIDLHRDILGKEMTKRQARGMIRKLKISKANLETLVRDLTGEELRGIEERCKGLNF